MSAAPLDPELLVLVGEAKRCLGEMTTLVQPNEPISDFEWPDSSFVEFWRSRLDLVHVGNLIEVATELLAAIKLPPVVASEASFEHLRIYHQMSQGQEAVRSLVSTAMARDYPHSMTVFAKSAEIAPQLNEISSFLSKISERIEFIEQQSDLVRLEDGVSFTVGPVSITFGALKLAVSRAWSRASLATAETNLSALAEALAMVATSSRNLLDQLAKFARDIPQNVKDAVQELSQLGQAVAKRGFELLRRAKAEEAPDSSRSVVGTSDQVAKELGDVFRKKREELGNTLIHYSEWTAIKVGFLKAIEEGQLDNLPENVFVFGYMKAYANALGISWTDIEPRVRHIIPRVYSPRDGRRRVFVTYEELYE